MLLSKRPRLPDAGAAEHFAHRDDRRAEVRHVKRLDREVVEPFEEDQLVAAATQNIERRQRAAARRCRRSAAAARCRRR